MPVAVREVASNGARAKNITVSTSGAPRAGDVVVVFHSKNYYSLADLYEPSAPSGGWSLAGTSDSGTHNVQMKAWTRILDADGAVSVTTNQSAATEQVAYVFVVSGHDGIDPSWGHWETTYVSNDFTLGGVDPAEPGALLVAAAGLKKDTFTVTTNPPGTTKHADRAIAGIYTGLAFSRVLDTDAATGPLAGYLNKNKQASASVTVVVKDKAVVDASAALTATATLSGTLTDVVPVPAGAELQVDGHLTAAANTPQYADTALTVGTRIVAGAVVKRVQAAANLPVTVVLAGFAPRLVGIRADLPVVVALVERTFGHVYQPSAYPLFVPQQQNRRRVLAQEILTGRWLETDLPVSEVEYKRQLCGPTVITGTLTPELPNLAHIGAIAGATWLHLEEDGLIVASGILRPSELDGPTLTVEAEGFAGYAHRIPYVDEWPLGSPNGVNIDPLDVVRECWRHIQSYDDGNLGVVVDTTQSPVRIGEPEREVEFETSAGEQVEFTAGPYRLNYWENTLCGGEIDKLAVETPFEYRELAYWNSGRTDVVRFLELAYPRVGKRRDDLTFEQGRNITSLLPFAEDGDYASEVVVTGKGEGRTSIRGSALTRRGNRIREVALINDKEIASKTRAKAIAADALGRLSPIVEIKQIDVLMNSPEAPLGTYDVGDDIYVQGEIAYLGEVGLWHRIVGYNPKPAAGIITLELMRTDRFIYGPMGRAALASLSPDGEWVYPNTVGTTVGAGPRVRDADGNWVPVR